jgi:hypothetical protein
MEQKDTTQPDWDSLYTQLLTQLTSPVSIETPQLGRVENQRASDLYTALNMLRLEAANANGISTAGVMTVGYDRGLGPKGGCS